MSVIIWAATIVVLVNVRCLKMFLLSLKNRVSVIFTLQRTRQMPTPQMRLRRKKSVEKTSIKSAEKGGKKKSG